MLITFRGRKSGRLYTTPVRYLQIGSTIRCFTSVENKWWRNLRGGAEVLLRIRGRNIKCRAAATHNEPEKIRVGLEEFLTHYPQDAAYYSVSIKPGGSRAAHGVETAALNTVMVEASEATSSWRGNGFGVGVGR